MLPLLVFGVLLAAPPLTGIERVPADIRPLLETTLGKQLLVGKLEILDAGDTDDGQSVLIREVAGEGGGCRTRLYRASTLDKAPMSWSELGSDCCDLGLLKCDRDGLSWMLHLHRVLAATDDAALGALIGQGVAVRHAASVDGKLKNVTRSLSVKKLGDATTRGLLSYQYLNMTISCVEPSTGLAFQCNADAGGLHMRFFFRRQLDKQRPKAPVSTLEGRLLRVEIDED